MSAQPPSDDMVHDRAIEPDRKDWTWVLTRRCAECGFVAAEIDPTTLGERIRANATLWRAVLAGPAVARRPRPDVWSPLEYAAHVRDVHGVMHRRLADMLEQDEPRFANWDQDRTAVEERYAAQDPERVAAALVVAADAVAARYDGVPATAWTRRGLRSDGSEFTVASLGRYHLHDVVHHAHDVGAGG